MSIGNLVIVGTSGHGKVIADIARLNGYEEIVFLDDDTSIHTCAGYPVIGKTDDYGKVQPDNFRNAKTVDVVIAIGNCTIWETIQRRFEQQGFPIATLVHPQAVVAESAELGAGTVVMAGAVVVKGVVEAGTYVGVPAGKITYSLKMSEIEEDIQNWEHLKKENNAK